MHWTHWRLRQESSTGWLLVSSWTELSYLVVSFFFTMRWRVISCRPCLYEALPCGPDLINNIETDNVKHSLTEFNLMTYDFHGSWDQETNVNAPLYDPNDADLSVDGCVKNWMEAGCPRDQINIGLVRYSWVFTIVNNAYHLWLSLLSSAILWKILPRKWNYWQRPALFWCGWSIDMEWRWRLTSIL